MDQLIFHASDHYADLDQYFLQQEIKRLLLVCGKYIRFFQIDDYLKTLETRLGVSVTRFSEFEPNPDYDSVVRGLAAARACHCDAILAVGGGSAMDVAKCIKLYYHNHDADIYFKQIPVSNSIHLIAMPTTAGSGSEATRYAVIYYQGMKQSISDPQAIPKAVLLDGSVLKTLPDYQRKSTMLDALCHAIESYWSVHSTDESKRKACEAIQAILHNQNGYLANDDTANFHMLLAAHLAGQAIDITQTTAGHAMCYQLTKLYGIAHGHAAALCVRKLWPWMICHLDFCIDARGRGYLQSVWEELASIMNCDTPLLAAEQFQAFVQTLQLSIPEPSESDYAKLRSSVNPTRLKNNPVFLDETAIDALYHEILSK